MNIGHSILACIFTLSSLCDPPAVYTAEQPDLPKVIIDPTEQQRELQKETGTVALRGDDERLRPQSQRQLMIGNTRVTFTGARSFDVNAQRNLNLNRERERDRVRVTPDIRFDVIAEFPRNMYLFSEFGLEDQVSFREQDKPMNAFQVQVQELFFQTPVPIPLPAALRIGRQQFFEPRRWLLDETLDGIHLLIDPNLFHVRLSVSTPISGTNDDAIRIFDDIHGKREQLDGLLYVSFNILPLKQKSQAALYVLVRDDMSATDDDPIWIGLRTFGRPKFKFNVSDNPWLKQFFKPRIKYWFDMAVVTRSVRSRSIRAFGMDIGATYIARKVHFEPYATLGYAYGSGDSNPRSGADGNFRQTGFHGNTGKFGGVVNFDYYGVLFDPELSNMHIFTAGIGIRPSHRTSIDLVYHHYEMTTATDNLRGIDVSGDLGGTHATLGDELDIVIGSREIENVRLRWRNGFFFPGSAFMQRDFAFETRFDIQIGF